MLRRGRCLGGWPCLAVWMLRSLGIIENEDASHPAVTIFLELMKRRRMGEGLSGAELVNLVDIGKTQTYYWLNKMKQSRLVSQGKKKVIERGAKRELKGFYLSGPDLSYTLGEMKKHVGNSFDDMIAVSERLQQVVHQENGVLKPDVEPEVPGSEIERPEIPDLEIEKPKIELTQQDGNTRPSQQLENSE